MTNKYIVLSYDNSNTFNTPLADQVNNYISKYNCQPVGGVAAMHMGSQPFLFYLYQAVLCPASAALDAELSIATSGEVMPDTEL